MPDFVVGVIRRTERGAYVHRGTDTGDGAAFWRPVEQCLWGCGDPRPGQHDVEDNDPGWVAQHHRQLVGDVEFERVRHATRTGAMDMTDKPDDAGRGALFKNDKKEKPSHPDYKGDATIDGQKFWVSAWIKTSEKTGQKYMSLAFREAAPQQPARGVPPSRSGGGQPFDDSIPFGPEWR